MAAKKGNQYYLLRSTDGREKIFDSPKELAEACNEYFKWAQDNPMLEEQVFHSQGMLTRADVSKMRPFSLEALCNHLDICVNTFKNYEKRDDFLIVTTRVRQIIDTQQFEGAAAGFLNPNIIARKLGLTDKSEVKISQEQPLFPDV